MEHLDTWTPEQWNLYMEAQIDSKTSVDHSIDLTHISVATVKANQTHLYTNSFTAMPLMIQIEDN